MSSLSAYTVGELKSLIRKGVEYNGDSEIMLDVIEDLVDSIVSHFVKSHYGSSDDITDDMMTNTFPCNASVAMTNDEFYGFIYDNTFGFMGHSIGGAHLFIRSYLLILFAIKNGYIKDPGQAFGHAIVDLKKCGILSDYYVDMHLGVCETTAMGSGSTLVGKDYPFGVYKQLPFSTACNLNLSDRSKSDAIASFKAYLGEGSVNG